MACIVGAVVAVAGGVIQSSNAQRARQQQASASAQAQQTQNLMAMYQMQQQSMCVNGASDAQVLAAMGYAGAQGTAATTQAMGGVAANGPGGQRPMGFA